jgi:hypothetical protein
MAPGMAEPDPLDALVERLERIAAELRAGDVEPGRAASLVEECARLAADASSELDRRVRGGEGPDAAGQLALGA